MLEMAALGVLGRIPSAPTSANYMQQDVVWIWDRNKADDNKAKHKVSFELASAALSDENLRLLEMDDEAAEYRYRVLCMIEGICLFIVHSEPEYDIRSGTYVGRIIHARKADPAQRRVYQNG